jgi:hypothetical protein
VAEKEKNTKIALYLRCSSNRAHKIRCRERARVLFDYPTRYTLPEAADLMNSSVKEVVETKNGFLPSWIRISTQLPWYEGIAPPAYENCTGNFLGPGFAPPLSRRRYRWRLDARSETAEERGCKR